MATIGNTYPTIHDMAKQTGPDGRVMDIAKVLEERHPILQDIPFIEGNGPGEHTFPSALALPSIGWREYNAGIAASKSRTKQITEQAGMLAGLSKVDVDLAKRGGNAAQFRMNEDNTFIAALGNEFASALFYSSIAATPEQIHGFLPRLNSTTGDFGTQVFLSEVGTASGSDQTSAVLVGWAPDKVAGFFPKGTQAGLEVKDKGEILVQDGSDLDFLAYVTAFSWKVGLMVRDYRYVVRLANLDTGAWENDYSAGPDIAMDMMAAEDRLWSKNDCNPVWYMHRDTFTKLKQQMVKRQANWLEMMQVGDGIFRPAFNGVPIVIEDALLKTEAVVS